MDHQDASSDAIGIGEFIGSATSVDEIIAALAKRGCKDLSSSIDLTACSQFPRAGGGYCDVYTGKLNDGTPIAIKSLRVYDGPNAETQRKKILKHAARELYYWAKLQHPNVIPLLGLSLFRNQISMISEWMENGNLMSFLELHPDAERLGFCVDICAGLCYIHDNGMTHGDLKAANIMVSPRGAAMIADFGCARVKDLTLKFTNTAANGLSIRWAAPELLSQSVGPEGSKAADVYAYGMTALEILSGKIPFDQVVQDHRVMYMVAFEKKHPPRPDTGIDDDIWEVLVACWTSNPDQRPSITRVRDDLGALINSELSIVNILRLFGQHGCEDVTQQLDESKSSEYPVSIGDIGDVYQGALRDGQLVRLNCLKLHLDSTEVEKKVLKHAARELYAWSKCNHPNILQPVGVAQFRNQIAIVSPWMENGSLGRLLSRRPQVNRLTLCAQIADGVAYLHSMGIVHGDIKGDNTLFSHDSTPNIAGFGTASLREYSLQLTNTTSSAGTSLNWVAPEMLDGETSMTFEGDVYSLGMTILEAMSGMVPYAGMPGHVVLRQIMRGVHPVRLKYMPTKNEQGDRLWSLLTKCWALKPRNRPTASQVRDEIGSIASGTQ